MTRHPRPCIECGTPTVEERCRLHRLPDTRPSAETRKADRRRVALLKRRLYHRDPTCQACRAAVPFARAELDHVIPLWKGGVSEEGNLQILCAFCHAEKTATDQRDYWQSR